MSTAYPCRSAHRTNERSQLCQPAEPDQSVSPCRSAHIRVAHLGPGLLQQAGCKGPAERNAYPARVQIWPAPVVVGVIGVGREQQQHAAGRAAYGTTLGPNCETREVLSKTAAGGVGCSQHDLVITRGPISWDLNGEGLRPAAPLAGGILGHLMRMASESFSLPHDLTLAADPSDLRREVSGISRAGK